MQELKEKSRRYSIFAIVTTDKFTIEEIRNKFSLLESEGKITHFYEHGIEHKITFRYRNIALRLLDNITGEYRVLAKRNIRQRDFSLIYEHEAEVLYFPA